MTARPGSRFELEKAPRTGCNLMHTHLRNSLPISEEVLKSFNNLPRDPHLKAPVLYRCRCFSHGAHSFGKMRFLVPGEPFRQADTETKARGSEIRQFEDIEEPIRLFVAAKVIP